MSIVRIQLISKYTEKSQFAHIIPPIFFSSFNSTQFNRDSLNSSHKTFRGISRTRWKEMKVRIRHTENWNTCRLLSPPKGTVSLFSFLSSSKPSLLRTIGYVFLQEATASTTPQSTLRVHTLPERWRALETKHRAKTQTLSPAPLAPLVCELVS